jgi:hypothetical protein
MDIVSSSPPSQQASPSSQSTNNISRGPLYTNNLPTSNRLTFSSSLITNFRYSLCCRVLRIGFRDSIMCSHSLLGLSILSSSTNLSPRPQISFGIYFSIETILHSISSIFHGKRPIHLSISELKTQPLLD